jgi:CheY-like chemotaxis protein
MKNEKVLVVDDEIDMRTYFATLLESMGYRVITASDGREGFKLASEKRPVLIILDIMMPGESGIRMYERLKTDEELKHIPVLVISAIAKKTFYHSKALLSSHIGRPLPEPEGYIEKPPEPEELQDMINSIIPA